MTGNVPAIPDEYSIKPLAFISCALRGDVQTNLRRAQGYVRKMLLEKEFAVPVCSVTMYTHSADLSNDAEVNHSFYLGVALMEKCDELHIFAVDEHISSGMEWEVMWWKEHKTGDIHLHELTAAEADELFNQGR